MKAMQKHRIIIHNKIISYQMFAYVGLLIAIFIHVAQSVNRFVPVWVTSPYIKADCANVIANRTGNLSTPTATIPFPGSAFNSIPNIGYGAFIYQGDDALASEMFEINRTTVTTSSFSVLIQITGYTHINILNVRFIAIDVGFPHYVNSFDNVPVNYLAGALVNISDGTHTTIQVYRNVINFTLQSSGHAYHKFSTPLSNNKILLFLTSLFLSGVNEPLNETNTSLWNPVTLTVDYQILTNETYQITVHLGVLNKVDRLHFSMIIFDQADIESSGQYMLVYERINFDYTGGFFHIPQEFVNNFIIGLTNFTTVKCRSIIYYSWNFTTVNGVFGLEMPLSVPLNLLVPPVNHYGFSYLYIKTWNCSNDTYFDPDYNMCSECPIVNCINCFNISVCQLCDFANGYIANATDGQCYLCQLQGCTNCSVSNSTNPPHKYCQICDTQDNYRLVNGTTCQQCLTHSSYFLNVTSMQCQLCTIPNCQVCKSLTECLTCDYNSSYGLEQTNNTCEYCNNSQNVFINLTAQQCVGCTLPNCVVCASLSDCSVCDQGSNYFLNSSTLSCDQCTIPDCYLCLNLTACFNCTAGYFLNLSSLGCETCSLTNCSVCSTLSTCQNCTNGSFLNPNTSLCQNCPISNCLTCASLSTCETCDELSGYFLNVSDLCEPCSLANCLTCFSLTNCSICDEAHGYFRNSTTQQCQSCTLTNCFVCQSLSSCSVCDNSTNYFLNLTSSLCQPCTLPNCLICDSLTECEVCDNSTDIFMNASSHLCQACSLPNCLSCLSLTNCSVCNQSNGYFLDPATQLCQPCAVPNCITCYNLSTCSACNESANYFLNSTTLQCELCTLVNCSICSNLTACSLCDSSLGSVLNYTSGLCEPCSLQGCLKCATIDACQICDIANFYGPDFTSFNRSLCGPCNLSCLCNGYMLPWNNADQQCSSLCGDGLIRVDEQCDDGNTNLYDGCSSSCVVEPYSVCSGEPSVCNITLSFSKKNAEIKKQGCNKFTITAEVQNSGLIDVANDIEILHDSVQVIGVNTSESSIIKIQVSYTKSLINQKILVRIGQEMFNTEVSQFQPLLYYSPSQCQTVKQLDTLVDVITPISYITLILSVMSCKIIGLELFGVLQLAYFSLISYDFLVLYMEPISKFKIFNGFNIPIVEQSKQPHSLQFLDFSTNILNNCNVMFFIMVGELIASFLLYLVSKLTTLQKLQGLSLRMVKQGFITILMFNIFNLSFSAGAHLKFAQYNDVAYKQGVVLIIMSVLLCFLCSAVFFLSSQVQYGQFINRFKDTSVCKIYIILSLLFRVAVGVYCSIHSGQTYSTLVILSFSFIFILYCLVNLPFVSTAENYRSCLIHVTELVILLVANYYRSMKINTPIQIKGYIFTPALLLFGLIVVCIVVSLVRLIFEIYHDVRNACDHRKVMTTESFEGVGEVSIDTVN